MKGIKIKVILAVLFASCGVSASDFNSFAKKVSGQFRTQNCKAFNSYSNYGYGDYAQVSFDGEEIKVEIVGEISNCEMGVVATFRFNQENSKFVKPRTAVSKLLNTQTRDSLEVRKDGLIRYRKKNVIEDGTRACDFNRGGYFPDLDNQDPVCY